MQSNGWQPFLSACANHLKRGIRILSNDHQQEKDAGKEHPASTTPNPSGKTSADLHGAAIIDSKGREVPITESMIVEAFDKIEQSSKAQ